MISSVVIDRGRPRAASVKFLLDANLSPALAALLTEVRYPPSTSSIWDCWPQLTN